MHKGLWCGATLLAVLGTAATASAESTPQCSYVYSANGSTSNITIAYMRPAEDLSGAEGAAGYDYVLQRNRSMAPGAQEQPIQAGQRAMRLSGTSLHLGVVSSDLGLVGISGIDKCSGLGDDAIMNDVPSPEVDGCASDYPRFLAYQAGLNDLETTANDFAYEVIDQHPPKPLDLLLCHRGATQVSLAASRLRSIVRIFNARCSRPLVPTHTHPHMHTGSRLSGARRSLA